MFNKENRYMTVGIAILLGLIALYLLAVTMGWATIHYLCLEFVIGAFTLMMVMPRLCPVQFTTYDEKTPTTSHIFGTVITNLGTLYFILEIAAAAVLIAVNYSPLTGAMYIQAALMVVYMSMLAFLAQHPAERSATTANGKTPTQGSAGAGAIISTSRRDLMMKELRSTRQNTNDPQIRQLIDQVLAALQKSPANSYQSMDEVDHQLAGLIGELGVRVQNGEKDMAVECLQLCTILVQQRNDLYKKTNKNQHKAGKAERKAEEQKPKSGVRGHLR